MERKTEGSKKFFEKITNKKSFDQFFKMEAEQQSGLQVVDGKEVILEPSKKSRRSKKLEQVGGVVPEKKKRTHTWTDKTRAAFDKCRAARLANIEKRKQEKALAGSASAPSAPLETGQVQE
jgi:hypothetical protein